MYIETKLIAKINTRIARFCRTGILQVVG